MTLLQKKNGRLLHWTLSASKSMSCSRRWDNKSCRITWPTKLQSTRTECTLLVTSCTKDSLLTVTSTAAARLSTPQRKKHALLTASKTTCVPGKKQERKTDIGSFSMKSCSMPRTSMNFTKSAKPKQRERLLFSKTTSKAKKRHRLISNSNRTRSASNCFVRTTLTIGLNLSILRKMKDLWKS